MKKIILLVLLAASLASAQTVVLTSIYTISNGYPTLIATVTNGAVNFPVIIRSVSAAGTNTLYPNGWSFQTANGWMRATNDSVYPGGAIYTSGTGGSPMLGIDVNGNIVFSSRVFMGSPTRWQTLANGSILACDDHSDTKALTVDGSLSLTGTATPTLAAGGSTFTGVDIPTNTLGTHGYSGYMTNGVFKATGTY